MTGLLFAQKNRVMTLSFFVRNTFFSFNMSEFYLSQEVQIAQMILSIFSLYEDLLLPSKYFVVVHRTENRCLSSYEFNECYLVS